ncbi:MAG TPA: hypothetical protein VFL79_14495 [Terriglobia bacterium]|nr:hypothetical protein [Terriglobia bacterium]
MNGMPPKHTNSADQPKEGAPKGPGKQSIFNSTPLLWITRLSLDAPVVAVLWQLLFARSFHVQLAKSVTILLALVVWLIYVADRLLDVVKAPAQDAEAARHAFYRQRMWAFLFPLGGGLVLAAWISLTRLDAKTFYGGLIFLAAVGAYLLAVHLLSPGREWLPKELLVGILFALGTSFPVWVHMSYDFSELVGPFLLFTALCWMNCAAIEYQEWTRLRSRRFGRPHPWTEWMGSQFQSISIGVAALALGFVLVEISDIHWRLSAAEVLSALAFALVRYKEDSFSIDQFRVLVDIALFTPLLFLVL